MGPRRSISIAVGVALAWGTGCHAATRTASPRATLETLAAAARRGDPAALYALLPERARAAESFEAFRTRTQADRAEIEALGTGVRRALDGNENPRVEVPLGREGNVATVEDPDGWRVTQAGFGPDGASTPAAALRALHVALARRSLGAVLRTLSARTRGSLEAEITALRDATRDPSALDVVPEAQRATVRLPDGRTIFLVREGDAWRVDDMQ